MYIYIYIQCFSFACLCYMYILHDYLFTQTIYYNMTTAKFEFTELILSEYLGKFVWAKMYPSVIHLLVIRYVYHLGSFTQLTPGTPVDEPLMTLLCGFMLQMVGIGCICLLIFLIISHHRCKNNTVNCQQQLFIIYMYMYILTSLSLLQTDIPKDVMKGDFYCISK